MIMFVRRSYRHPAGPGQADRNLMNFNKEKYKVLNPGQNDFRHQKMLEGAQ